MICNCNNHVGYQLVGYNRKCRKKCASGGSKSCASDRHDCMLRFDGVEDLVELM